MENQPRLLASSILCHAHTPREILPRAGAVVSFHENTCREQYSLGAGGKHAAERARPRAQQRQKAKRLGNSQAAPLMEIAAPEDAAPCRDLNAGKRAGIPKGFCNKAQGCAQRATLGNLGRPPS